MKKLIVAVIISLSFILTSCDKSSTKREYDISPDLGKEYEIAIEFSNIKSVSLYYPDIDAYSLVRIVSEVRIVEGDGQAGATLRKLLRSPNSDEYEAPFKGRGTLSYLVISRKFASVNISGDFSDLSDMDIFIGAVSVCNTLSNLNNVEYVEVQLNGKTLMGRGLLTSPMTALSGSLHNLYLEHNDMITNPESTYYNRTNQMVLYYLNTTGDYLLAEVRKVAQNDENIVKDIISHLKNSPNYGSGMVSAISQNVLMNTPAFLSTDEEDNNILSIELEAPKHETMDNKTRFMMAGAITMSIQSEMPSVDYVRITINGQNIIQETLLSIELFAKNVGEIVTLYSFSANYKHIERNEIAMSQEICYDTKARLIEMLSRIYYYDESDEYESVGTPLKNGILDVTVNDNCAIVNISKQMVEQISMFNNISQKVFVYAMVNTLTEFDHINSVQFIVEGILYEKLGDDIYIETPLLNNPGIVYD